MRDKEEVTESGKIAFQLNLIGPGVNPGTCLEKQGIRLGTVLGQTLGMHVGPADVPRPFGQAQAILAMVSTH